MFKIYSWVFILNFLAIISVHSQTSRDTITEAGTSFLYKGLPLSANQLLDKVQNNPGAYTEMSIAKLNYDVATVFIYGASFCVGFPLGQALAGGICVMRCARCGSIPRSLR